MCIRDRYRRAAFSCYGRQFVQLNWERRTASDKGEKRPQAKPSHCNHQEEICLLYTSGGVSGVATLINFVTGLPIGAMNFAINVPLVIIGFLILGKTFTAAKAYPEYLIRRW